jgi:hypothetical protein
MKTDSEVHLMLRERKNGKSLEQAAARAGMNLPTARKYLRTAKLPSTLKPPRAYRTHPNPFETDWPWVEQQLHRYTSGQLRTFQRHVARWRALHGPGGMGCLSD